MWAYIVGLVWGRGRFSATSSQYTHRNTNDLIPTEQQRIEDAEQNIANCKARAEKLRRDNANMREQMRSNISKLEKSKLLKKCKINDAEINQLESQSDNLEIVVQSLRKVDNAVTMTNCFKDMKQALDQKQAQIDPDDTNALMSDLEDRVKSVDDATSQLSLPLASPGNFMGTEETLDHDLAEYLAEHEGDIVQPEFPTIPQTTFTISPVIPARPATVVLPKIPAVQVCEVSPLHPVILSDKYQYGSSKIITAQKEPVAQY